MKVHNDHTRPNKKSRPEMKLTDSLPEIGKVSKLQQEPEDQRLGKQKRN